MAQCRSPVLNTVEGAGGGGGPGPRHRTVSPREQYNNPAARGIQGPVSFMSNGWEFSALGNSQHTTYKNIQNTVQNASGVNKLTDVNVRERRRAIPLSATTEVSVDATNSFN